MKEFEPIKIAVLSFIFLALGFMFLFAVFGEFSETVYADTVRTAQGFVGQPVSAIVANYGEPNGRLYSLGENESTRSEAYWCYDNIVFHIRYDVPVGSEGIVTDVEGVR